MQTSWNKGSRETEAKQRKLGQNEGRRNISILVSKDGLTQDLMIYIFQLKMDFFHSGFFFKLIKLKYPVIVKLRSGKQKELKRVNN